MKSFITVINRALGIVPTSVSLKDSPVYPLYEHYGRFVFQFTNVVDLLTVIPFYVSFDAPGDSTLLCFISDFK